MPDAVIVSACRTAIATARKGSLARTSAFELAETVVRESLERTQIAPEDFDDIVLGETLYGGGVIARHTAVVTGLTNVPGASMNRHCATGMSAVQAAAGSIKAGMDEAVIAGGTQSMSTSPMTKFRDPLTGETQDPWTSPSHPNTAEAPNMDMSITVGWNAAQRANVTREEMDAWALRSHQNAVAAIDEGRFLKEIVPMKVTGPDGEVVTFEVDEHPRRGSSMEKLASLPPLHPEIPGFSITAGNASGLNDAASALVLTSDGFADAHGLKPLGRVLSWANVGVDPAETGLAPTLAIPKALKRAGLSIGDVDLWEINEAFASMCVATIRNLEINPDLVNVSGSGCGLGHPIAATGARMLTTLIYELQRRGGGVAVASMCAGGGMGAATVIEVNA